MLIAARRLDQQKQIDIEDAALVVNTAPGSLTIRLTTEISTSRRPVMTGWLGPLIALLIGGPSGGRRYGDAVHRLHGQLGQLGMDEVFVSQVAETIDSSQSAVFLLFGRGQPAADMFQPGDGHLLRTAIPEETVDVIRDAALAGRPR